MSAIPTTINPDQLAYDAMQVAIAYIQKRCVNKTQLEWCPRIGQLRSPIATQERTSSLVVAALTFLDAL